MITGRIPKPIHYDIGAAEGACGLAVFKHTGQQMSKDLAVVTCPRCLLVAAIRGYKIGDERLEGLIALLSEGA